MTQKNNNNNSPDNDDAESDRYSEDSRSQIDNGFRPRDSGHEYDYDELDVSTEASYTSRDVKALDNFAFSKDFLPRRFDRHSTSDVPLKIICFAELACDLGIVIVFITQGMKTLKADAFWFLYLQYGISCLALILTLFWLNYKLHAIFISIYRLFVDLNCVKTNSKYYSGLEIPDFYLQSKEFPPVTIQIPVYKENLHNTIKPTLLNCCREADRYMKETGALCNIIICDDGYNLISEADRTDRVNFYRDMGVGFTARPHPSKYPRMGRFKKAGNLNFSMNYGGSFHDLDNSPDDIRKQCEDLVEMGAAFGGDTRYGDYILLIDSDTRLPIIPMKENGCLKRLAKEMIFDGEEVSFIQCYTGPYMSIKSTAEKSVFHHTCNIYNSILVACAIHSMAPLVGHNAFLNMKAITGCARVNEETGYYYFWAEDRISEDFDLMMRSCENGYTGRYASHAGIFLEGVSFSYMTEYFKISKFACGAAELIYNPVAEWCTKGIISSDLIGFLGSKKVEWYNKLIISSYILNFIALSAAHFGAILNVFLCEWLYEVLPIILMPVNLLWEALFTWTACGGILSYLFGLRVGFDKWLYFKQCCREAAFLTCLYGSISVRFSIMSFTHLFNWNLSFGATAKDDEKITFMDWTRSTPMETTVYIFYLLLMIMKLVLFTAPDKVMFVVYFGCTPLMWNIFLFWAGPVFFDILPTKTDKTTQDTYQEDEKMFVDKYFTQVPNSRLFNSIKVGSSAKLAPEQLAAAQSQYTSNSSKRSYQSTVYDQRSGSSRMGGSNSSSHHHPRSKNHRNGGGGSIARSYPSNESFETQSDVSHHDDIGNNNSFGVERPQSIVNGSKPTVV